MVWISTINPDTAEGRLKDAYDWQTKSLGRPTEFTQLGSLDGDIVHARLAIYRASENIPSRLTTRQRQLLSYLTSLLNRTPHCAALSRTALNRQGDGDLLTILDSGDYDQLDAADAALAHYAHKLTLSPGDVSEADIDTLRRAGFHDLEILHANNQIAHLNYTNRIANGLGLVSEPVDEERSQGRVPV